MLARLSGERWRSEQHMRQMGGDQAVTVSQQWAADGAEVRELPATLAVAERVDSYEATAAAVLLLADAMCVKPQKATRQRGERGVEGAESGRDTGRVNPDGW